MQTASTQFEHELRKRVDERMVELAEIICAGTPKDYAEYRQYVGRFQELKHTAETVFGEVNTKLNIR